MFRLANARAARQALTLASQVSKRNFSRYPLSTVFDSIDRQLREVEKQFDHMWNSRDWFYSPFWSRDFRPLGIREHPTLTEAFRLKNPIVEEGGAKKFLLELDVRRFKPDEVNVKVNEKENTLTVEAKHSDENSKFEYQRKITLPEGVVSKEMTCHFTTDGVLQIKAPYSAPQEALVSDTEIPVKHE